MNHALKGKALIVALAIYSPGVTRQTTEHEEAVYFAVDNADLDDEHKAEFYARLAEKLTPTTRLDQAEQIIEDALHETWSVTRG